MVLGFGRGAGEAIFINPFITGRRLLLPKNHGPDEAHSTETSLVQYDNTTNLVAQTSAQDFAGTRDACLTTHV